MRTIEYACTLRPEWTRHALEFGVATGTSLRLMRTNLPPTVEVFGFDSFHGLPEDWRDVHGRLAGVCTAGFFSTNGVAPYISGVTIYTGLFVDTIPRYKVTHTQPIGLLHVDCDLYSSTCTVLNGVGHLLVPGSIVVFDEWIYNNDPWFDDHEQRAFYEWVQRYDRGFELVKFASESNEQQIVRITQ